jgi:hypothetical protein
MAPITPVAPAYCYMADQAEDSSLWRLNAGALWLNGLVVAVLGVCVLITQVGDVNGYGPLFAVLLALAIGTLGNLLGLLGKLLTGRAEQAVPYLLGLLVIGGLLYALWTSLMHSSIGKPPGG